MSPFLTPHNPPNAPNWGSKSPSSNFQPTGWRLTKMSIYHILGYIFWLWSDAMNNLTAFVKVPNEWTQMSTICAVVERPDHHCGDHVVYSFQDDPHLEDYNVDQRVNDFIKVVNEQVRIIFLYTVVHNYFFLWFIWDTPNDARASWVLIEWLIDLRYA